MALAILVRMSDAASKKDATRKDAALEVTLPSDLAGSHALIEQLACTVDSQTDTIEQLHREKDELKLTLAACRLGSAPRTLLRW